MGPASRPEISRGPRLGSGRRRLADRPFTDLLRNEATAREPGRVSSLLEIEAPGEPFARAREQAPQSAEVRIHVQRPIDTRTGDRTLGDV